MTRMKAVSAVIVLLAFNLAAAQEYMKTEEWNFVSDGRTLNGLLDKPVAQKPSGIVLIVQGYGKSNVVSANWYSELRSRFVQSGLACFTWDKPGCGKSEGTFDINQSVQSSAREVLAAISALKSRAVPGSAKVGLWGISRAGWICPLVMEECPSIAFWISVSGTDDKENFGYLLETNLRIEGRNEEQTKLLVEEWRRGNDIFRRGGSFEEYQRATEILRRDTFWLSISGDPYTEDGYQRIQKQFIGEHHEFDEATGLMIYVPHFRETLNKIQCPVLAIFGEKDANVDWRKTLLLYKETIGSRTPAILTIKSFPDGNHNIQKCRTGGFHEHLDGWHPCDGYYETMSTWLKNLVFVR